MQSRQSGRIVALHFLYYPHISKKMNLIQAGAGIAMAFLLSQAHSLAEEKKKK